MTDTVNAMSDCINIDSHCLNEMIEPFVIGQNSIILYPLFAFYELYTL